MRVKKQDSPKANLHAFPNPTLEEKVILKKVRILPFLFSPEKFHLEAGKQLQWKTQAGRVLCKRALKKATGDCLARGRGSAGCALAEEEIQDKHSSPVLEKEGKDCPKAMAWKKHFKQTHFHHVLAREQGLAYPTSPWHVLGTPEREIHYSCCRRA